MPPATSEKWARASHGGRNHKIWPHEVATGITLDMDRKDLGHPDDPGLWDHLHGHCTVGTVVCADCRHPVYLMERQGRRFACQYTEAQLAAWAGESGEHQAWKDTVGRVAERVGLTAEQESAGKGRKRVTDVMVLGGVRPVGWEIQLSPASPGNLVQRIDRAMGDAIVPSWLTTTDAPGRDAVTDRTPLTMIHGMSAMEVRRIDDVAVRSGVKGIRIVRCGSWHKSQSWHRGLRCTGSHGQVFTQDRVPTLAKMIEGSASGAFVPVRWPRRVARHNHFWIWATAGDAARFWEAEGMASPAGSSGSSSLDLGDDVRMKARWHDATPGPAVEHEPIPTGRVPVVVHGTSAAGWHLRCGDCQRPFTEVQRHERTTTCVPCAIKWKWVVR